MITDFKLLYIGLLVGVAWSWVLAIAIFSYFIGELRLMAFFMWSVVTAMILGIIILNYKMEKLKDNKKKTKESEL